MTKSIGRSRVRRLTSFEPHVIHRLAEILIDCVEGGASISFMVPLALERAMAFWNGVATEAMRGERAVLVAEDASGVIMGTVHLVLRQPENQPHRADVAKLLVHRAGRRQGLAEQLMRQVDVVAVEEGKRLLVLDTATGADGERLYRRIGWQPCGVVPDYALWPDGTPCATTFMYRFIGAGPLSAA